MAASRRSFRRRPHRAWFVTLLLIVLGGLRWSHDRWQGIEPPATLEAPPVESEYSGWQGIEPPATLEAPPVESEYSVVRVVDGDTLIVAPRPAAFSAPQRKLRVRLLGINCPESVKPNHPIEPWGPEASAFTRQFVSGGVVRLRFDKRRLDQYDRYLAYVYVGEQMLNEELVRAGLATVRVYPGDSQAIGRRLQIAEREAQQARRGVWSGSGAKKGELSRRP